LLRIAVRQFLSTRHHDLFIVGSAGPAEARLLPDSMGCRTPMT
jgi:hypothetical protein